MKNIFAALGWLCLAQDCWGQSTDSFPLVPTQNVVYSCDYSQPIAAVNLASTSLPCSALYTPVLQAVGATREVKAETILDSNKLTAIAASKCFKLRLVTRCIQHYVTSNEISTFTETQEVNKDECLSTNTCVGCEVANNYPPAECKISVFGANDVSRTIVFKSTVTVYANQIGSYSLGDLTSTEQYFDLGGQYRTKVFFSVDPSSLTEISIQTFAVSSDPCFVISTSAKRLLRCSGANIFLNGIEWVAFSDTYVRKDQLYAAARRVLAESSQQNYFEFYTNATLAVSNYKHDYLDCRLKNVLLTLHQLIPNSSLLFDLGPGERFEKGYLQKFKCYSVAVGELRTRGSCIHLKLDDSWLPVLPNGESREEWAGCTTSLRLNRTHVLNVNTTGSFSLAEYGYPSLQEEESILSHPPEVSSNINEVRTLIKQSTIYDRQRSQSTTTTAEIIPAPVDSLVWLKSIMRSPTWTFMSFLVQLVSFFVLIAAAVYLVTQFFVPWLLNLWWKRSNDAALRMEPRKTFDLDSSHN